MPELPAILNAVLLSLVASLGTGLGALLSLIRKPGKRSFGFLMGITAGVMITLSFLELVNQAWELQGFWTATFGFGAGAIAMLIIDILIPHIRFGELETRNEPSMEAPASEEDARPSRGWRRWWRRDNQTGGITAGDGLPMHAAGAGGRRHGRRRRWWRGEDRIVNPRLLKTGVLLAIGITIHNLPEGIAVGAGYMHAPSFGLLIALAIMLHNIPEGIATALPLCESGVCKRNAFLTSLFSGMTEPLGALIAALFLQVFTGLVPFALAFAGGVMLFITLDELIPAAREYGHQHSTAVGIIIGSLFVFILEGAIGV
jgi:ZIP family zinc transporter